MGDVLPLAVRELIHAAELARHGAWRLGRRMLETGPDPADLANDLERLIGRQAELWRERSRPGGLEDSLERLRRLRQDPRSTG